MDKPRHSKFYQKYIDKYVNYNSISNYFKMFTMVSGTANLELKNFKTILDAKKISKKNSEYLIFLFEVFYKIDCNVSELAEGFLDLIKRKSLMNSMFLLRGILELIFFNIYLTNKSKKYLINNKTKSFIELSCCASLGSKIDSIKATNISRDSHILSKVIKKFRNKKIHINDCIKYYAKSDFKSLTKNYILDDFYESFKSLKKENIRLSINKDEIKKKDDLFNALYSDRDLEIDAAMLIDSYHNLCEIIHPTALMINDSGDENTELEYKQIIALITSSYFAINNNLNFYIKREISGMIIEHQDQIIEEFKKILI